MNKTHINLINTKKLLLCKENRTLLEKVNFENDTIFLEQLFFEYSLFC